MFVLSSTHTSLLLCSEQLHSLASGNDAAESEAQLKQEDESGDNIREAFLHGGHLRTCNLQFHSIGTNPAPALEHLLSMNPWASCLTCG